MASDGALAESSLKRTMDESMTDVVDQEHEVADLKSAVDKHENCVEALRKKIRDYLPGGVNDLEKMELMLDKTLKMKQKAREVLKLSGLLNVTYKEKVEADNRSIYVSNVDYSATEEALEMHFSESGLIKRVTILRNLSDGHPKGCAYIEFADEDSVKEAMKKNGSTFFGREIRVTRKRTNHPGWSQGNRHFRGGHRGRRSCGYMGPRRTFTSRSYYSYWTPYNNSTYY